MSSRDCRDRPAASIAAGRSRLGRRLQVDPLQAEGGRVARIGLLPARGATPEPEPERAVVSDHGTERLFQTIGVKIGGDLEQERLVPVVRLGQAQVEEPALNGRQGHRSFGRLRIRGADDGGRGEAGQQGRRGWVS